jgi:sigma-54 specific flagellar transcriptional regulator A
MQVKLLRVLQERTFERVGSNRTMRCNVRIIAATHRDLDSAISAGRFREDLYYRLNVFPVQMPPLRERLEDLPVLIAHLVQRQEQMAGRHIRLDKQAMNCLTRNPWPGNVRELSNLLERLAVLFPEQTISADDLPERYRNQGAAAWIGSGVSLLPSLAATAPASSAQACAKPVASIRDSIGFVDADSPVEAREAIEAEDQTAAEGGIDATLPDGGIDLKNHLSSIEIGLIRKALRDADGTVAGAARLLNIRRTTLVEKLRKYHLSA